MSDSPPRRAIRVLIVEDHPVMRKGLRAVLEQEGDLSMCGEAETVDAALEAMRDQAPDAAVVDISLKGESGLQLLRRMKELEVGVPVLVLSMHSEAIYAERALRAGARGYITKSEPIGRVVEGIHEVLRGQIYVREEFASRMLCRIVDGGDGTGLLVDRLSDREFEVFELIGEGIGTREIAKRLHISVKTVDAHREHIKQKLGMASATELLTYAVRWTQLEREEG